MLIRDVASSRNLQRHYQRAPPTTHTRSLQSDKISHIDTVISDVDTVISHIDTVISHTDTVILSSCHLVDRMTSSYLVTLLMDVLATS